MSELDSDIRSLFDAEETAPRDPVFVQRISDQMALARAIPAVLAGLGALVAIACAVLAGPQVTEALVALSGVFSPIFASSWTLAGLCIAGAAVAATLYLLRGAVLSS